MLNDRPIIPTPISVWIASSLGADIICGQVGNKSLNFASHRLPFYVRVVRGNQMKIMDPLQLSLSLAGIAVRSQRLMINFLTPVGQMVS
jgi:hypothetical protein